MRINHERAERWREIEVTKSVAAQRQLDQALRMFFRRDDMLSVHTLAAAAFQLLADIGRPQGIESRMRSSERILPEALGDWIAALNRTQNFLKHADRDADATLKYVEKGTAFLLLEGVELAGLLLDQDSRERLAYRLWFVTTFEDLVADKVWLSAILAAATRFAVEPKDRDLWGRWLEQRPIGTMPSRS